MEREEEQELDPWGSGVIKDYGRLQAEFGIQGIDRLLPRFKKLSPHLSRGIDFGQRDLGRILDAIDSNKPFAVMSGIKPDGTFHLGNKMTADDMVFFQSLSRKATVFYAIADVEAYCDNGISFQESSKMAVQNVADILALGLDPARTVAYMQSEEMRVMRLMTIFSRGITNNTLRAVYGERPIGLYISALVQAGDILMPQLQEFGGPKPVLVPVGADQDPHIRLTRDLATRYHDEFGFIPPSSIYHRLEMALTGGFKMSKRDASSGFTLDEDPRSAAKKVSASFTGGRATVEEQRRLGAEADKCPVYDLYRFHFAIDDEHVRRVYDECTGGIRLCGECKQEAVALVKNYLEAHQKKRVSLMGDAQELLTKNRRFLASVGK
ncbi:MAG TPA: tryptophan--tRNA ligase [Nitrososphaerales archaeon]|nr:tryptophan--tRNA ligase [Nitrososphaerales archaeon]